MFLAVLLVLSASETPLPPSPRAIREILGVTHVGGAYDPDGKPGNYLRQGAEEILRLGSKTIKLWFTQPQTSYAHGTVWPGHFDSLVDLAKHPNYAEVFQMPFKHYILETYRPNYPEHYWRNGASEQELADEREAFRALTEYLLTAYRGTGKTFVLQNWEGDWALRGHYDPKRDPDPLAIQGMIVWLNARQQGVETARKAVGENQVHVYHAAEVNLVRASMLEGKPNAVNRVLPHTPVDLVSYSAYDTLRNRAEFGQAIEFIAQNAPDSPIFGAKNVYVGEYGWPENDSGPDAVRKTIDDTVEIAMAWGCPYAVYWELYCNEPRKTPVRSNDDVRGFWLVKPDGSRATAWAILDSRLRGNL